MIWSTWFFFQKHCCNPLMLVYIFITLSRQPICQIRNIKISEYVSPIRWSHLFGIGPSIFPVHSRWSCFFFEILYLLGVLDVGCHFGTTITNRSIPVNGVVDHHLWNPDQLCFQYFQRTCGRLQSLFHQRSFFRSLHARFEHALIWPPISQTMEKSLFWILKKKLSTIRQMNPPGQCRNR
jgi:hypothetical protein